MEQLDSKPWYKHFWPWYIIAMKLAVISACFYTVYLITQNPISMVVDDYYKEGRAINLRLEAVAEAERRGIEFVAQFNEDSMTLEFSSGEPDDRTALMLRFYHPTLDRYDFNLRLPHSGDGVYRQELPADLSGHWQLTIEPFDGSWRVGQNIVLPNKEPMVIRPENYGV